VSIFDPDTGKLVDPDALRSVGFAGQGMELPKPVVVDGNRVTAWVNENTGRLGGYDTEHPSGRVDVNAHVEVVRASADPGTL
jgi:hypothetical protein